MTYRFLADKLLVDIRFQNARIVTYVVVDFVCTGTGHRQTDKPAVILSHHTSLFYNNGSQHFSRLSLALEERRF